MEQRNQPPQGPEGFQRRVVASFYHHNLVDIGKRIFLDPNITSREQAYEAVDRMEDLSDREKVRMRYGAQVLIDLIGQNVSLGEIMDVKVWQIGPEPGDILHQVHYRER